MTDPRLLVAARHRKQLVVQNGPQLGEGGSGRITYRRDDIVAPRRGVSGAELARWLLRRQRVVGHFAAQQRVEGRRRRPVVAPLDWTEPAAFVSRLIHSTLYPATRCAQASATVSSRCGP